CGAAVLISAAAGAAMIRAPGGPPSPAPGVPDLVAVAFEHSGPAEAVGPLGEWRPGFGRDSWGLDEHAAAVTPVLSAPGERTGQPAARRPPRVTSRPPRRAPGRPAACPAPPILELCRRQKPRGSASRAPQVQDRRGEGGRAGSGLEDEDLGGRVAQEVVVRD